MSHRPHTHSHTQEKWMGKQHWQRERERQRQRQWQPLTVRGKAQRRTWRTCPPACKGNNKNKNLSLLYTYVTASRTGSRKATKLGNFKLMRTRRGRERKEDADKKRAVRTHNGGWPHPVAPQKCRLALSNYFS